MKLTSLIKKSFSPKPTMHKQEELLVDLKNHKFINDKVIMKWHKDSYSTSKHLLTLYSLVIGLSAKTVVEIGFGRSTFVLARAVSETGGKLISADKKNFSYLLSSEEKKITESIEGLSTKVWKNRYLIKNGVDFAFLDYFSDENLTEAFCSSEIKQCLKLLKTNGVIAIHDGNETSYAISKVIQKIAKGKSAEVIVLPYNYGLALIRKTGSSPYGKLTDEHHKKD